MTTDSNLRPTILFLYMVPHTGHQKAAEAVMEAIRQMDPNIAVEQADLANQAFPLLGRFFNHMYLQFIQRAPFLWDFLYDNPDIDSLTREMRSLLLEISSSRTRKILKAVKPSCIVCTQAVAATILAQEKKKGRLHLPLIGIVTDFGVHRYWIHSEIDLYLVAHEQTRNKLARRGIPKQKILVTGIPILPQFGMTSDQATERKRFGFDPKKKVILIVGGSRGLGAIHDIAASLLPLRKNHQLAVVCGRNDRLRKRMIKSLRGVENAFVFGYVKEMASLMKTADLIVTKPGGLTCSEALASHAPLLLIKPLPGQEDRNARFLVRHKAAHILRRNSRNGRAAAIKLLDRASHHRALKASAIELSKPLSAWEAGRHILEFVHDQAEGVQSA